MFDIVGGTMDSIIEAIHSHGGEAYIVGGAVRDELLGIPSKDVDFLIRKLHYSEIKEALAPLGRVFDQEIGGKVSTLKAIINDEEFDIAIPRVNEISTGDKHTDFEITLDPFAPIEADLSRRDFTFNALAKDTKNDKIIDNFGGIKDLDKGLVCTVGDPEQRFKEDPLRILRALQFATRFGFEIEEQTFHAITKLSELLFNISNERIYIEFEKAWTKGKADNLKLIGLLKNSFIGNQLFGENFKPIYGKIDGNNKEKFIGSFIMFFMFGGKAKAIRPTNEMLEYLESAKKALWGKSDLWSWLKRDQIPLLIKVFDAIDIPNVANRLRWALEKPLTPKELAINGHDIMKMGFRGKEIGAAQKILLSAIHKGRIENTKKDIEWLLNHQLS